MDADARRPLPPPRRRGGLASGLAMAVVAWLTMLVVMALFESSLIFFPERFPGGYWDTGAISEQTGLGLEDRFFSAADGVRLHAWWLRPVTVEGEPPLPVLLLFHGNAGNLSHRLDLMLALSRLPAEVVILDYRGYGRSEGSPSEKGLYLDGRAAWDMVTGDGGVAPERVVLHGRSLGGAVAVELASGVDAGALIVESSFTSIPDMARRHYPLIPRFLIRTRLDSAGRMAGLTLPKLFIHSDSDEIVPFDHGRRLFELAPPPKRFHRVSGAGHNDTWIRDRATYLATIREFLDESLAGGK